MKNYIRLLYTAIFIIVLLFSSCKTIIKLSTGKGNFTENIASYTGTYNTDTLYFPDTKIEAQFAYNRDSIRILLRTDDQMTVSRLLVNGLSVWVDPEAEKNRKYGVSYPGVSISVIERYLKPPRESIVVEDTLELPRYTVADIVDKAAARRAVLHRGDLASFAEREDAMIFLDDYKALNYVITIPFSFLGIAETDSTYISIGITSEGAILPQRSGQPAGTARPPGGQGYPPRASYPHSSPRQQPESLRPIDSWIKFHVNTEQKS